MKQKNRKKNVSFEIEDFVETRLCKLVCDPSDIAIARALRAVNDRSHDICTYIGLTINSFGLVGRCYLSGGLPGGSLLVRSSGLTLFCYLLRSCPMAINIPGMYVRVASCSEERTPAMVSLFSLRQTPAELQANHTLDGEPCIPCEDVG